MAEILDRLKQSVFVDLEIVFVESRNKGVFVILGRCVQDHHVHIYLNGVLIAQAAVRQRRFLRPSQTRQCNRNHENSKTGREMDHDLRALALTDAAPGQRRPG